MVNFLRWKQISVLFTQDLSLTFVFAEGEAEAAVTADLAEETGLVEEDLVAVSYIGDELDLETVGDIIAIIEDKVLTAYLFV